MRELARPDGDNEDPVKHVALSPAEAGGDTRKPVFGEPMRGIWASKKNPRRDGLFVRVIAKMGRFNQGLWYQLTDGKGAFWEYRAGDTVFLTRALGCDEWRVQPGAPNPHGLPVEPMPAEVGAWFRAWSDRTESELDCQRLDDGRLWCQDGDDDFFPEESEFIAWRPAAVGPGAAP